MLRPFRRGLDPVAFVPERGLDAESAVALPALDGDGSSGICTFSTGRLAPPILAELVRDGGVKLSMEDIDTFRFLL